MNVSFEEMDEGDSLKGEGKEESGLFSWNLSLWKYTCENGGSDNDCLSGSLHVTQVIGTLIWRLLLHNILLVYYF